MPRGKSGAITEGTLRKISKRFFRETSEKNHGAICNNSSPVNLWSKC